MCIPFKIISLNQLDRLRNRGRYIFPVKRLLIREADVTRRRLSEINGSCITIAKCVGDACTRDR